MNNKYILFLVSSLIININLIAQEVLLYGNAGYSIPISQTYYWTVEDDYTELVKLEKSNFSKGFTISGGVSYFWDLNIGFDFKVSYLFMLEEETRLIHEDNYIEHFTNSNLSFVPTIILQTSHQKFRPYMKFGFSINFVNIDLSINQSKTVNTYSNDYSIGINATSGCNYNIDKHFAVFSEFSFSSFTFYANKKTNGDTGIVSNLKDEFKGGIPTGEIAQAFPFSSMNISIGLKYRL